MIRNALVFALTSCLALASGVGCSDTVPPTWPDDAELAFEVDGTSVVVSWPVPTDNVSVEGIEVFLNGASVAELPGNARSYSAAGLEQDTRYAFEVLALDGEGQGSERLSGETTTADMTGPNFPAGARITLLPDNSGITWPQAADTSGVASYEVQFMNEEVANSEETSYAFSERIQALFNAELAAENADDELSAGDETPSETEGERDPDGEDAAGDSTATPEPVISGFVVVAIDVHGNRSFGLRSVAAATPAEGDAETAEEPAENEAAADSEIEPRPAVRINPRLRELVRDNVAREMVQDIPNQAMERAMREQVQTRQ